MAVGVDVVAVGSGVIVVVADVHRNHLKKRCVVEEVR